MLMRIIGSGFRVPSLFEPTNALGREGALSISDASGWKFAVASDASTFQFNFCVDGMGNEVGGLRENVG
jgi:hypothetical protein